ncbi:hypothetical protein Micbo1qcDRAFT_226501 [Microdochium bolleyi]|uniref:Zn(2)-C6 fungal-type domain-containing protein n=1 Tax=Microdochium bolleyi TaxID=196109 RepID=A0A136J015_9PEZI|nr:hypothetical protein Micbo1qcDRAFT_226501 [Microdochium bolleyi]
MYAPADPSSTARRKSCLACTRSKRRCDLGVPLCARCAERQMKCVYAPVVATRRRRVNNTNNKDSSTTRHDPPPRETAPATDAVPEVDMGISMNEDPVLNIDDDFGAALLHPTFLGGSGFDMMDSIFATNLHNTTTTTTPSLVFSAQTISSSSPSCRFSPLAVPSPPQFVSYYPQITPNNSIVMVPSPKPLIVLPADADALHSVLDPRLHYAMAQLRGAPSHFALSCQTPWSHPLLYRDKLPRSIAIAQACCALHTARGAGNAPMVTRNIAHRARELCLEHQPSSSQPMLDLLAHTQALLLYHIMLHVDPDPLARHTMAFTAPELQKAMVQLHDRTKSLNSPYPIGSGPLRTIASLSTPDTLSMLVVPSSDGGPPVPIQAPPPWSRESNKDSGSTAKPMPMFLSLSPLTATRQVWQDWVLHESARRTVLMAGLFMMLQMLVEGRFPFSSTSSTPGSPSHSAFFTGTGAAFGAGSGGSKVGGGGGGISEEEAAAAAAEQAQECCAARDYCVSPWTLSRECWEAEDAVDFAVGWNKRAFTVQSCADLELRVHEVDPVHVDTFSKMMLTLLLGIDETKGWFLAKGGIKL